MSNVLQFQLQKAAFEATGKGPLQTCSIYQSAGGGRKEDRVRLLVVTSLQALCDNPINSYE